MCEVRKHKKTSRLIMALLSVAMVFAMMPLCTGLVFAEEPAADVLTVQGEHLVKTLSYDTIKTMKNDENIKQIKKEDVVFHTKNKGGTEEDFTVTGVTIEDLIKLAGLKEGKELESVIATANDGSSISYSADKILNEDLQGNKAMFIWTENESKVQKIAIGQFTEGEVNRSLWLKGETISLTIVAQDKPVVIPGKVTKLTAKNVKGKKVNLTWKSAQDAKTYQVSYKLKSSKKWTNKTAKSLKYTVKGLKKGKTYQFKVRAKSADKIYGAWSDPKNVKIKK